MTHKKSVDDLARSMALQTGKVWLKAGTLRKCWYPQMRSKKAIKSAYIWATLFLLTELRRRRRHGQSIFSDGRA